MGEECEADVDWEGERRWTDALWLSVAVRAATGCAVAALGALPPEPHSVPRPGDFPRSRRPGCRGAADFARHPRQPPGRVTGSGRAGSYSERVGSYGAQRQQTQVESLGVARSHGSARRAGTPDHTAGQQAEVAALDPGVRGQGNRFRRSRSRGGRGGGGGRARSRGGGHHQNAGGSGGGAPADGGNRNVQGISKSRTAKVSRPCLRCRSPFGLVPIPCCDPDPHCAFANREDRLTIFCAVGHMSNLCSLCLRMSSW